ncbi:MAG: CHASE2 domain-containing protein, partial [Planctomycetes bacterium]|nr:CHASE2 domain-containing protein [Planctomycetota bacterium]
MATSTTSKLHSSLFGLVIGGLVSLIIAALYLQGVFTAYEWKTRDLRQQHAAPRPIQSQDILILDIDEESIQRLRSQYAWPWPRQLHAYVVEYMTHARAKALVFDVLFVDKAAAMVDPDRLDPLVDELRRTAGALTSKDVMPDKATAELKKSIEALAALNQHNDEVLAKSIQAAGNVFLAMVFDPSGAPLAEPVAKQYGMPASALALKPIAGGLLPLLPVPKLLDASVGVGHINYVPDSDGILRSIQLGYEHERRLYPSLALRVAMCHLGVEPSGLVAARGESFRLTEDHKRL